MPAALPRSPRSPWLVAALSAPLLLGACTTEQSSGGSFTGAKLEVKEVVTKLSELADDRKASDICSDLLTTQLAAAFAKAGGGDCAKAVDRAIRNADYTKLVVDTITLNGSETKATTAVARITVQKDGPERSIELTRSATKAPWLISGFDADAGSQTAASTTPATTPVSSTTP
ncbi:MAG: hypothetical protein QM679_12965 [Patulibacter sp.]